MGAASSARSGRKAPRSSGKRPFSPAPSRADRERAPSARGARENGGTPAIDELEDRAAIETDAFDEFHAPAFVQLHRGLRALHLSAYGTRYRRGLYADWIPLRRLVQLAGSGIAAFELIERAFAEPLLVAVGIHDPVIVANWRDELTRARVAGTRLSSSMRRVLRAAVDTHLRPRARVAA